MSVNQPIVATRTSFPEKKQRTTKHPRKKDGKMLRTFVAREPCSLRPHRTWNANHAQDRYFRSSILSLRC